MVRPMPRVRLTAAGRGVGASDEADAFSQMVQTEIAHVAPAARPETRVGADDAVAVTVELDRRDQSAVGEVLERLLQGIRIESSLLDDEPVSDGV